MSSMERYKLLTVIGEGSFGRALLVQCAKSQEKYVLKEIQLPKNRSEVEENRRREAVLLSTMKHPNIVAFREAFEDGDLLCIVMEFCGGGDLLQRIQTQKTKQFSVDDILRWFAQMCAGIMHVHEKKVLHRDLKSKNIFLTDNGTIKLGDFGSACILNSSRAFARTYVGTPYYVAPEIWDNKPYNNKSDVWSLGCVLYELCTLHHPFQAPSWKSLILKVCRGSYPPMPKHLPYELHYVVKQMFKTNPKDRPSLNTILTSHRVSKLLRPHLPSQEEEEEEEGREKGMRGRTARWRIDEGEKVAEFLRRKSLLKTSSFEAVEFPERAARKQWATQRSDSVVQMLANASLLSSHSSASSSHAHTEEKEESRQRRRWERNPPERLLSLLEKVPLSRAFSTYEISRGGDDPLLGPLSLPHADNVDGPEQEVEADEDRLSPRSDDEDTDFEEESPPDWIEELEKMCSEQP